MEHKTTSLVKDVFLKELYLVRYHEQNGGPYIGSRSKLVEEVTNIKIQLKY